MDKIIFRESNHWYTWKGEPVEVVPYAKPRREGICPACSNVTWTDVKKDKSTCKICKAKIFVGNFEAVAGKEPKLPDARKYGLFPSISRFDSYGEPEFTLSAWSRNEWKKYIQDLKCDDINEWNRRIQEGQEAFDNRYSDPGSYIHGQIFKAMEGEPWNQEDRTVQQAVWNIKEWEADMGITTAKRERGYCDPEWLGLGGMIDFDSPEIMGDYKCKFNSETFELLKKGYDKTQCKKVTKQLAGYRHIQACNVENTCDLKRAFMIPIRYDETHLDTGEICPIEIPEERLEWGLQAIYAAAEAWRIDQEYDPREMFKQGQCKSLAEILNKGE